MTAALLALICLASPAPETQAGLQSLLVRLGDALTRGDGEAAAATYDFGDMLDQGVASGLMQPLPRAERRHFERAMPANHAKRAAALASVLNWQHTEILKTDVVPGGRYRLTVRHRSERLNTVFRRRYWVRPGLSGWRIYDDEDVDLGVRQSEALAAGLTAGRAEQTPPWIPKVQQLWALVGTIQVGDVATARAALDALSPAGMPPAFAATYWLLRVAAKADDDPKGALADAAAARAALPKRAPIALWLLEADARLDTGDPKGALRDAERFLSAFPGDPEALSVRGFARLTLGDRVKAKADFDGALRAAPRLLEAWAGRRCLAPKAPLPADLAPDQRAAVAEIQTQRCH